MNEILKITFRLTISCLLAAFVMGGVFVLTDKARKHNEHMEFEETMLGLLGYGKENPPPEDLKLYTIYRYIIFKDRKRYMGYMVPKEGKEGSFHQMIIMDLKGRYIDSVRLDIGQEEAFEMGNRKKVLNSALKDYSGFNYADMFIIAEQGGKRVAYLLPGRFPGFKTFIKVMLALDPKFTILGLEIMEHEEDPGLGGEIEQDYFKNQFRDKSLERIKTLKVIKKPLPEDYKLYLEMKRLAKGIPQDQIQKIREKYRDDDIYAITGATISSRSVTNGVKKMVKNFVYRMGMLDRIIEQQEIEVPFS